MLLLLLAIVCSSNGVLTCRADTLDDYHALCLEDDVCRRAMLLPPTAEGNLTAYALRLGRSAAQLDAERAMLTATDARAHTWRLAAERLVGDKLDCGPLHTPLYDTATTTVRCIFRGSGTTCKDATLCAVGGTEVAVGATVLISTAILVYFAVTTLRAAHTASTK